MTQIHLVRHGQTDWNLERRIQGQTDSILTAEGREQARALAEQLKDIPFHRAYASSSIRARDTAEHILSHHGIDLTLQDDLREIHLGGWEGNLYDDVKRQDPERLRHFLEDPSRFRLEGAESFSDVQQRAVAAVEKIIEQDRGHNILIVSHGVWIKSLLAHMEGRHLQDFWLPPKMINCCHSIIVHDQSEQWKLDNFTIHQYANLREW